MTTEQKIETTITNCANFIHETPINLQNGIAYLIDSKRYCSGTTWSALAILKQDDNYSLGIVTWEFHNESDDNSSRKVFDSDNEVSIAFHSHGFYDTNNLQEMVKEASIASWCFSDFFSRTN